MTTNLFAGIPDDFRDELLMPLLNAPPVRIERIVSNGPKAFGTNSPCTNGWSS